MYCVSRCPKTLTRRLAADADAGADASGRRERDEDARERRRRDHLDVFFDVLRRWRRGECHRGEGRCERRTRRFECEKRLGRIDADARMRGKSRTPV